MKKTLIYALALALTLSLTACSQPKAEQPTDPAPSTSAPELIVAPEPIKDTQSPENTDPQEAGQELEELSGAELESYFQLAYDSKSALAGEIPVDALIKQELHIMPYFVAPNKQLPEDYEDQYRAWRPVETQEPEQQQETSNPEQQQNQTQQSQTQQSSQTSKPNSGGQQQSSKPNTNTNGGTTSSTVEVDDSSIGISSGSILSDPSKLTEGIDPNQNPWDVQGEIFYGGG